MIASGKLSPAMSKDRLVYHDPCELGRGCNVYYEPRAALSQTGILVKASKEYDESLCCGGSLGSLTLDLRDRAKISEAAVINLVANNPDKIVTACPLCLKTFSESVANAAHPLPPVKVVDFAEVLSDSLG